MLVKGAIGCKMSNHQISGKRRDIWTGLKVLFFYVPLWDKLSDYETTVYSFFKLISANVLLQVYCLLMLVIADIWVELKVIYFLMLCWAHIENGEDGETDQLEKRAPNITKL